MSDYVSAEALEDGAALVILKTKYLKSHDSNELFPFLGCLRDSLVYVPVNVVSEPDEGGGHIRMRPEFLTSSDGKRWFPIFSQVEQLPEQYKQQFSVVRIDVVQCIKMAHSGTGLEGLVLDAFTKAAILPFSVADLIPEMPSMLGEE